MIISSINKVKLLECVNSKKELWKVRWNEHKVGNLFKYEERGFNYKPSFSEIKELINKYYNTLTELKITKEFVWNGNKIDLSKENQMNYSAFANQIDTLELPLKIKLLDNTYLEFSDTNSYKDFYSNILKHINKCLQEGWALKDNVNWDEYK